MKFDIITIGSATRDVFLPSSAFKIVNDPKRLKKLGFITGKAQCLPLGGKVQIEEPVFATGGGATNAAVTFSRQGFKTASLFKIGSDISAEEVVKEMKKEKISLFLVRDKKLKTDYSAIFLSQNGERTILNYRGASANLKAEEIPFKSLDASWAYISPGKISFSVMGKIFSFLAQKNISIAFNPSKHYLEMGIKKLEPFLNKTKVVLLNREEASYLTNINYNREKEIFKRLDEVVLGIAVMTEGPKGLIVSDGKTLYHCGTFRNGKVVDRTGAGDAFGSGFVAGLIEKSNLQSKNFSEKEIAYAIRLGLANATSVIEHIGGKEGIITKSEFKKPRWKDIKIKTVNL